MRIQPTIITALANNVAVQAAAVGGVWPKPIAAERFAGDPTATPAAFDHGTPLPSIYVTDPGAVPHPTDWKAGYVDFWPEVHFYWPVDNVTAPESLRSATRAAIDRKRLINVNGIVARVLWVEDSSGGPILHPELPDTLTDYTRYRVTTRTEEEPADGY